MTGQHEHDPDFLSEREGRAAEAAIATLKGEAWVQPLLSAIAESGGVCAQTKDLLFELRFGQALAAAGIMPDYEIAGERNSRLDFGFNCGDHEWRVELMRLNETQATSAATTTSTDDGVFNWLQVLSTGNADDRQSEEGETLKAVERICQKCERDGRPHKFASPDGGKLNVLLVDMRLFLHGGDRADRLHIALGGAHLPGIFRRFFRKRLISGVFDGPNPMKGAAEARERVHLIGFVNDTKFEDGGFGAAIEFVANPRLFANADAVHAALKGWPLQPYCVLNANAKAAKTGH